MKKICLTLSAIFCFSQLIAQLHPTCDGARYRSDLFEEVTVTTGLKFGEGETITGNFQELFLDVYEPAEDAAEMRPVILVAFGGSFIGGSREDLDFLCRAYAKKGYVAVTIDYRLYDGPFFPLPNADQMTEVVIKAVSDMKAAVRFMREDAATDNEFRVDSDNIFVGGISAGAIVAAHTAVLDENDELSEFVEELLEENGGLDGNSSTNTEYSSEVSGFINFSGGLSEADWIDAEDPPFFSVHDEFDDVVPYGEGFASIFGIDIIYMEGSSTLQMRGDEVGVMNELQTLEDSYVHVSYLGNPSSTAAYINASADFMYELLCADFVSDVAEYEIAVLKVQPNPTKGVVILENFSTVGQVILYNAAGQRTGFWTNTSRIDLSDFAEGIYFLEAVNAEGERSRTILIREAN